MAETVGELADTLNSQLKNQVESFFAFSIAINESTDMTDVAQRAVFVCGVDQGL